MKPISNEDALLQEHDAFMRQVSESGVPIWMLQYYGDPNVKPKPKTNPYVNNQKNLEGPADKHDPTTPV